VSGTLVRQDIAANLAAVRARIQSACARSGRDPSAVTLIGVGKTQPAAVLAAALDCGLRDLGENYVQEAAAKFAALPLPAGPPGWTRHLVGSLQRNKAHAALECFDVIHSLDSERLADAIARYAVRRVPVFAQVNIAAEPSKRGVAPAELSGLLAAARALPELEVRGLMVIPPEGTPESARPWFREARDLADLHGLAALSMGMTGDFEVAIEEGATHVRVGRAIFGERQP
jgi:pyridoxal phosphate enzyme (YggS family)